ncbi:MAG: YggS family pyridoxal phosphate-dependent enzyme [Myxococcaceae bacterium]
MTDVAQRLAQVQTRIHAACQRAKRSPEEVTLIAVSKRHPPEAIRAAWEAGQRHFGENYAQELRDKATLLSALPGLHWHAIGPLQRNKAKYIAQSAHAFHALDSIEIAAELDRRRTGDKLPCFIEVNVSDESTKSGVALNDVETFVEAAQRFSHLRVDGLMALPSPHLDEKALRAAFRALCALAQRFNLPSLSLGTTADFEIAIEEGATHIRVGTAIFGERPKPPPA